MKMETIETTQIHPINTHTHPKMTSLNGMTQIINLQQQQQQNKHCITSISVLINILTISLIHRH